MNQIRKYFINIKDKFLYIANKKVRYVFKLFLKVVIFLKLKNITSYIIFDGLDKLVSIVLKQHKRLYIFPFLII